MYHINIIISVHYTLQMDMYRCNHGGSIAVGLLAYTRVPHMFSMHTVYMVGNFCGVLISLFSWLTWQSRKFPPTKIMPTVYEECPWPKTLWKRGQLTFSVLVTIAS